MFQLKDLPWQRVVTWALALGVVVSIISDWGRWDRLPINLLLRVLIVAASGVIGLVLDYFASTYVRMGTNVIESMGVFKFSNETEQKITNGFIFITSLVGAIAGLLFIR
ncbi:MAG: hypothetical protein IVW55_11605 [Chloroflexi bacterium]|nr:hypothetical protein [Chloroflexota bacterium]